MIENHVSLNNSLVKILVFKFSRYMSYKWNIIVNVIKESNDLHG